MSPLSRAVRWSRTRAGRLGLEAVRRVWALVPRGDGFVVYPGAPLDLNGLALVAAGLQRGQQPVLLVDDEVPMTRVRNTLQSVGVAPDGVEVLRRRSPRGLLAYFRAATLMFTHVPNGGVTPPANRLVVNVWHGDGAKGFTARDQAVTRRASDVVVSGTRLGGEVKAAAFNLRPEDLLLTGNPRISLYRRPLDDDALAAMGLEPGIPVVLWAPTYRATGGTNAWSDSSRTDAFTSTLADGGRALQQAARSAGRQIVLRPHPRDRVTFEGTVFPVITDDVLGAVGGNMYTFLPRVAAMITDYSSLWADYLVLDRPMGFFCPDLAEYEDGRGLDGEFSRELPGPLLQTDDELLAFLSAAELDSPEQRAVRSRCAEWIGLVQATSPAEDLISWAFDGPRRATRRARPVRAARS